jgi:hypothetical protein
VSISGVTNTQHFVSDQTAQILNAQALVIQRHCVEGLLNLMRQLGVAYNELSRYNCRKAVKLLDDIPAKHRRSCWVLGHLGKAHFELGEYKEAKRYFLFYFFFCISRIRLNLLFHCFKSKFVVFGLIQSGFFFGGATFVRTT